MRMENANTILRGTLGWVENGIDSNSGVDVANGILQKIIKVVCDESQRAPALVCMDRQASQLFESERRRWLGDTGVQRLA
jgi:hypothetical protein